METYDWQWVQAQVVQTVGAWEASAAATTGNVRRYRVSEQNQREQAYDEALDEVEEDLQRTAATYDQQVDRRGRIVASFARFSARALDLDGESIGVLTREFLPVGTGLASWARRFDPDLSMPAIIQAARNAWTACGLQPLFGSPIKLTPSILGYSLLYPYSDNYLDDEQISAEAKLRFSRRFRRRLLGEERPPANQQERAIWALIALIERQYPRARHPQVFESLLAIHQAQEASIQQLHHSVANGGEDCLRMSCAKGGSSVLADACLANGSLNAEESRFAFDWGVLLQLGDDLQDLDDDLCRGSGTLFSRAAAAGQCLDELAIQLLNFGEKVRDRMEKLPHGTQSYKQLLSMSWRSLIIRAIADSHQFFSPGFVREAERRSPFRFDFLRARSERLASRHGLYAKLFDTLLERHDYSEDAPALECALPDCTVIPACN
jgi:hypothetical protein